MTMDDKTNGLLAGEKILDVRGLANSLGLPISKIYTLTRTKRIPCYKIGRDLRFRESEIVTWLERHRI
jgi:excisionase family DNA binding protein